MYHLGLEGGLPQTWTGFISCVTLAGTVIGTIIAWFATRAERKSQRNAHAETNKVYEQTIDAQKQYAETIARNHEAEIATAKEAGLKLEHKFREDLRIMTDERDQYKAKSHELANDLNSIGLKIKEFELRPDLTTLYHSEKGWHEQNQAAIGAMVQTQAEMLTVIAQISAGQDEIVKYFKKTNGTLH